LLRLAGEHQAAAWALDLPGVRSWLAPAVYRWVARHRQGLSAFFKSEPSAPQGCGCPEDKESDDTP
jgi:hypothetical protein